MPPLILIYNFWKCVLVDLLSTYTGPSGYILLLSVEQLWIFENLTQSLSNMCLYDVCSLILAEPHTNRI